jgi:hypothetical protein
MGCYYPYVMATNHTTQFDSTEFKPVGHYYEHTSCGSRGTSLCRFQVGDRIEIHYQPDGSGYESILGTVEIIWSLGKIGVRTEEYGVLSVNSGTGEVTEFQGADLHARLAFCTRP